MYRLLSAVTARAATTEGLRLGLWAACGSYQRAGLPPLRPRVGRGPRTGLGLALGVKLAGGAEGASPAPPLRGPRPEAPPQAELLQAQERPRPVVSGSPGAAARQALHETIDSSRDLHRIKGGATGGVGSREPGAPPRRHPQVMRPLGGYPSGREDPIPGGGMPAVAKKTSVSRSPGHGQKLLGGCPSRGGGQVRLRDRPSPSGCPAGTPLTVSARPAGAGGRGPGRGRGGAGPREPSRKAQADFRTVFERALELCSPLGS